MRAIDGDALKRKAQKVATEAWKMKLTAKIETTLNQFIDWIDAQPTVQPEPQWTPVTDGLPNIREDVLISYYDEVMAGWLNDDGTWFTEECGKLNMNDIAAWMPLPEAYKGEKT